MATLVPTHPRRDSSGSLFWGDTEYGFGSCGRLRRNSRRELPTISRLNALRQRDSPYIRHLRHCPILSTHAGLSRWIPLPFLRRPCRSIPLRALGKT